MIRGTQATLGFEHVPQGWEDVPWGSTQGVSASAPLACWHRSRLLLGLSISIASLSTRGWEQPASTRDNTVPPDIPVENCRWTLNSGRKQTKTKLKQRLFNKKEETAAHATPCMTLKNFMPGRTPDPEVTHCMGPFIWHILQGSSQGAPVHTRAPGRVGLRAGGNGASALGDGCTARLGFSASLRWTLQTSCV